MKPEIITVDVFTGDDGKKHTTLSIEELKKLIDKAYDAGYEDGKNSDAPVVINTPTSTPWWLPTWTEVTC